MLRTLSSLGGVNPGFRADHVLTFSVSLSSANTTSSNRILQTFEQSVDRIQSLPGVKSAAVSALIPLGGSDNEIPFLRERTARPTSQGDMSGAITGPCSVKT
jgi:hypothetical protein